MKRKWEHFFVLDCNGDTLSLGDYNSTTPRFFIQVPYFSIAWEKGSKVSLIRGGSDYRYLRTTDGKKYQIEVIK